MKKIIGSIVASGMLAAFAFVGTAQAVTPTWDTTGSYDVEFTCTTGCPAGPYAHDMDLVQDGTGNLTGSGGYPANGSHVYHWVLVSGSVTGNTMTFTANYTASADAVTPLTVMHVNGTIDTDGTMSGTWDDNYQGGTRGGTWETVAGNAVSSTQVVSGGGHISVGGGSSGKKTYTFSVDISVDQDLNESGTFTLVNHTTKTTCNYDEISNLVIADGQATFTAGGSTCPDATVVVDDNGEPGANVDKIAVTSSGVQNIALRTITGGNFQVEGLPVTTTTFTASNSNYYNGPTNAAPLYATGPISFTWDTATGNVTGGYYNETIGSTIYYNVVDSGSVSGGAVNLTFSRTVPNSYGPFNFTGTLAGNSLTGQLDGPYYFSATGTVSNP